MRQTNPIWPGRPGRGTGGRESPPRHDGAKQSQFGPEEREGQRLGGKGVMVNSTFDRLRQNKANLPQRPPRGAGRGSHQPSRRCGVLRQTNPISGSRAAKTIAKAGGLDAATRGANVRHRLDAPLRETKPIPGEARRDEARGTGDEGQMRQTKPILAGGTGEASALPERSYGTSYLQQALAKQSQFAPTAPEGRGTEDPPAEPALRRIVPNKPNSSIVDCGSCHCERSAAIGIADTERSGARRQNLRGRLYQQTQFAPAGRNRSGKPEPETWFVAFGSPIHPACGSMASNKANLRWPVVGSRWSVVQTKPILRRVEWVLRA
jgi:hypothetical protein